MLVNSTKNRQVDVYLMFIAVGQYEPGCCRNQCPDATEICNVFYRALCCQETGEQFWENEWEVTQLSSGNTSICVFKTNDYRVGFISENNG